MCFVTTIKFFLIREKERRKEGRGRREVKHRQGGPMPHEKGLTKNEVKTESKAEKSSPDKSG